MLIMINIFKWFHTDSIELNIPLDKVWRLYMNPDNWPQWVDRFESCDYEGALKSGSVVKAKIKNKSIYLPIFITEIQPHKEVKILIKSPFFVQESCTVFKEISPIKTRLIMKTSIKSLFVPFLKSYFLKKCENTFNMIQCFFQNQ